MSQELRPPQLITNSRMLYFCWVPADPAACAALLPAGLTPAENKAIYINQYVVDSDAQTSHFGAYSLTYMGLDLDGLNVDGDTPGRFWTHYFNSNPGMRAYAAERGIPAESGNVMDILETTQVQGTGSLAWAGTRVRVTKTGESVSIAKLEGDARAVEIGILPSEEIIKTIAPENA